MPIIIVSVFYKWKGTVCYAGAKTEDTYIIQCGDLIESNDKSFLYIKAGFSTFKNGDFFKTNSDLRMYVCKCMHTSFFPFLCEKYNYPCITEEI